ncbi:hypothetical protein C8J57DRAFT_1217411 [Mycena rebaudengoi]|nr:hypothetical protein C8J57DRAFT_1217411 [Mycena rebaudengoi]
MIRVSAHFNDAYVNWGLPGLLTALQYYDGTALIDAAQILMSYRKPFSEARYSVVAPIFGLPTKPQYMFEGFAELNVPPVMLPTTVVDKLVTQTVAAFATPGPILELENEATTGLFLSATFQTLLGLFGGILRNRPERPVAGTELNSGGIIEGEVFCAEMFIFARELKHRFRLQTNFLDSLAHVLSELFDIPPNRLITVSASLSDGITTHYISYNGLQFSRRSIFGFATLNRLNGIEDYLEVSLPMQHYTFALLLEGYYQTLQLYYERSLHRGEQGDRKPYGSHRTVATPAAMTPPLGARVNRQTSTSWYIAIELAFEARAFFQRAAILNSDEPAEMGLDLLFKSLQAWHPQGRSLLLPPTVRAVASSFMEHHEMHLTTDPDPNWWPRFPGIFPKSAQALRAQVVEKFWGRLPSYLRTTFEPLVTHKATGDSFTTLAAYSQNPLIYRLTLESVASPALAMDMMTALEASKHDWGIVI